MLFSSITFLGFFLPAVIVLYFALPSRTYRNAVLLLSSLLFYAWGEPKFVILMIASILFNFNMGILIAENPHRKATLIFSIAANLALLFVFKYLGFSCLIANHLISALHLKPLEAVNFVLPIGISFYTFQEISYLADVYKNPSSVQKNILKLGLYIAFFPQLIAGPIVRYSSINIQIEKRAESIGKMYAGFQRFIIGLSKKVIIANNLAFVCDSIYSANLLCVESGALWIAAVSYALQIYYDFSGYSDMAVGLSKIFGFDLPENFNFPYAASSITDFWKRWHISLTSFFRDYVYISLGGNRKGKARTMLNRVFVFFLTGLWHGAAFNFIFWGLAHGFSMIFERVLKFDKKQNRIFRAIYRIFSLLVIMFLWVLFRNGTKQSVKIWLKMFGINGTAFSGNIQTMIPISLFWFNIDTKFFIILAAAVLFSFPWFQKIPPAKNKILSCVLEITKCAVLIALLGLCFAFLANNTYNPFIYFRF